MSTIAFIGLGNMGSGMARRLLGAGHRVSVFNRTREKALPLTASGARIAECPRTACIGAEAVFVMVADDVASRAVWLGEDGILAAALHPQCLAIECSTLSYPWATELAAQATGRGLRYVDAPVTGQPDAAAKGELIMLAGANASDLAAAEPYLTAISKHTYHFGPVGAGTAYKLMINLMGAVQIAAAAEGVAFAKRAGLDLCTVADAIASGQGASPQVVRNVRRMVDDDHDRNVVFTPVLRMKDIDYALHLAGVLGLATPLGDAAGDIYSRLIARGDVACNESKIIEVYCAPDPHGLATNKR